MTNSFFVLGVPFRKNSRSGCSLYLYFLKKENKGCRFHPSRALEITIVLIPFKKICKKNLIYLRKYRTKSVGANQAKFDMLCKTLFRVYASYAQL